jgi:hypothetical protein
MADYDNDDDTKAGGSDMDYVAIVMCSGKHQAQPLIDDFERLIKEVCLNHAHPIRIKLMDCNMMKNFMTSRSLTRDKEPEEHPGGSDVMPFTREDAVMTVYDAAPDAPPPSRRHCMSNLSLRTPTHCSWGLGNTRV